MLIKELKLVFNESILTPFITKKDLNTHHYMGILCQTPIERYNVEMQNFIVESFIDNSLSSVSRA